VTLSRCPRCGARGCRIADTCVLDGVSHRFDYCGRCGKNWPAAAGGEADRLPPTASEIRAAMKAELDAALAAIPPTERDPGEIASVAELVDRWLAQMPEL
jgi:hypothetical protein